MPRPVHFEIHATDVAATCAFYESVFGWQIQDWSGYAGAPYFGMTTSPVDPASGAPCDEMGIDGAITQRPETPAPSTPTPDSSALDASASSEQRPGPLPPGSPVCGAVLTIGVDDFDAYADKITQAGGKVAMPKYALPGMAWQGYFLDVDGNIFGLHQPDENAA